MNIKELQPYIDNKLIKVSTHQYDPDVQIACYTKTCFFDRNSWDDVTKTHRGQVFYKGQPVNKPFDKIFNLGEVEETDVETIIERMKHEDWEVFDKVNGHLFIVSVFPTENGHKVVYSTKGSLPNDQNDILNDDIRAFEKIDKENWFSEGVKNVTLKNEGWTFLFESVCEHDKHTLWEKEVETYGENTFVLLGAFGHDHNPVTFAVEKVRFEFDYDDLMVEAIMAGFPAVKKITDGIDRPIENWFKDEGTEGYVIRFVNGDRVKIKTNEYWRMRFKKDLTPERIIKTFSSKGIDGLRDKLPEEISNTVISAVWSDYKVWFITEFYPLLENDFYMTQNFGKEINARNIFTDDILLKHEKHIVKALYVDEKSLDEVVEKSMQTKETRKKFFDSVIDRQDVYLYNVMDTHENVVKDF